MPSVLPDYQYDIFISYRQKDNKYDGWVTEFVSNLKKEIEATFKEEITIYFDENPTDGLLESHTVDKSLEAKLKCLVFIPVISHTYCDPNSFAWQHEFQAFVKLAGNDNVGLDVELPNGNFAGRILPVRIHEIDSTDQQLFEQESGNKLRAIDFIYKSSGVNRPLLSNEDDPRSNQYHINYRDQVNKVTNAIKEIIQAMKTQQVQKDVSNESDSENASSFTREVEKRDLLRVSLVYIIISMVFWKLSVLLTPTIGFSSSVPDIIGIILVVLFPAALFLAWKFERAPGGFVRVGSQASKNNPLSRRQRKPLTNNALILVLILLMVSLYAFFPERGISRGSSSSAISDDDKSIAVLYFDNMSGDPEQEYFSDGITEEIIARLAKVEGLKVISRTSVRVYKGEPLNLRKIASELGVTYVLEGSVRRGGNQVRITAQLINAFTDEHIWAETFDHELNEVLQVQANIAELIVSKFEIEMTPETDLKVSDISTKSTEAYESYLKARHIAFNEYNYIFDSIAFERSKELYEKAIQLDQDFAEAYAGLADLYDSRRQAGNFTDEMDSIRHALSNKAYQLDPNSAFANYAKTWTLANRENPEWDSAVYHAAKALYLEPTDFFNYFTLGGVLWQFGQPEMAIPYLIRSAELNPLDHYTLITLAACYQSIGDYSNADKYYGKAKVLPTNIQRFLVPVLLWIMEKGKLAEAEKLLQMKSDLPLNRARRTLKFWKGEIEDLRKEIDWGNWGTGNVWYYSALLDEKERYVETVNEIPDDRDLYLPSINIFPFSKYKDLPEIQETLNEMKRLHESNAIRCKQIIDRVMSGEVPY